MRKKLYRSALPLLLLLLFACRAEAAVTSVPVGEEALEVFENRRLNVINFYRDDLYLPSFADVNAVEEAVKDRGKKTRIFQSANLPTFFLQTRSGRETRIHESKQNRETGAGLLVSETGETLWMGELEQIRIRGNSSAMYSKKPYQIKLKDKADLLGMGKARTWILLANVIDGSMLRNDLALRLAAAADMPFTPECRFVDVVLNGSWKGTYLMCEKVQVQKQRTNITDLEKANEEVNPEPLDSYPYVYGELLNGGTEKETLKESGKSKNFKKIPGWKSLKPGGWTARLLDRSPEDITGGYLLECGLNENFQTSSRFVCDSGWKMILKEPEEASPEEVQYIFRIFQQIDRAMTEGDWDTLEKLIDTESWVKKYVFEEILANFDAGARSQYFYKDRDSVDGKVYCGPVWDYDNCLGISYRMTDPEVFYLQDTETAHINFKYDMFLRLTKIPRFMELVKACYRDVFRPLLADLLGEEGAGKLESVRSRAELISASREVNYTRWKHYHEFRLAEIGDSEEECLDYLLDYLGRRVKFLDSRWLE